jgi:hypothetical protein
LTDDFNDRLERIRQRFAASLPGKIDDSIAAVPKMSESDAAAVEAVVVIHRKLHEMCGVAPSVGFPATGKAARAAESVLRDSAKAKRPLTAEEVSAFIVQIDGLRSVARTELQSNAG